MPDKIKIGFIGVGQIAQHHLRAYREMGENVEVVAAADINPKLLKSVADEFEIRNTYKDFRDMLKRNDIQAVDVCLHNNLHMPADCRFNLDDAAYRWHNVHGTGDLYHSAQHHWIAALQGRVELLPTAELALNTMLISEGIYLSEKLGREVTVGEIRANSRSTAVKI